ncbi:MAG TPA: DUF6600 domain-containing protein [Steroidobacteraceae bacterium]|nr:DUF6600 domain-containing protein [Steroidobacteraceae bacterium]
MRTASVKLRQGVMPWLLGAIGVLMLCQLASAEDVQTDPPGRVARLSFIQGEVTLAPAGTEDWVDATLNRPLTSGDRVWTDDHARAELQVGGAAVNLDEHTGFSFVDLDDEVMQMSVTEGAATIRVHSRRENEKITIETPNGSVDILHPGEYHIEVNPDNDRTIVKTRSGEAEMVVDGTTYPVKSGEQGEFAGLEHVTANIDRIGPRTDFENWANERDQQSRNARSSKYVSEEVVGYQDLDDHGDWIEEPEYGYVWRPRYVVHDWAPYRDGRWVWVAPWGWTWVDNAPWGFAPFHYGRWVYLSRGWCWIPGPRHLHPVYSPAFVGWVGSPGVSVSVSIGPGVGWFPLGPREVYVPCYRHSPRYIRYINASNTVIVDNRQITNIYVGRGPSPRYRYWHNPRAVTVVTREHFIHSAPVRDHLVRVNERELRDMQVHPRAPALAPTRESVLAGRRVTPIAARHIERERTIANRIGTPNRMSFEDERRAVEANHGRPVDRTRLYTPRTIQGASGTRDTRVDAPSRAGDVRSPTPNRAFTSRDAAVRPQSDRQVGTWNTDRRNNDSRTERVAPPARLESDTRTQNSGRITAPANPRANGEREFRSAPAPRIQRVEPQETSPPRSEYVRPQAQPHISSPRAEPRENFQSRPQTRQPQSSRIEQPRSESRSDSRPQSSRQQITSPTPRGENRGNGSADRAQHNGNSRRFDARDR